MPVKRRNSKRQLNDAALLEIWRVTFQCGCDFFSELEQVGIAYPLHVFPPEARPKAEVKFMTAAEEAWKELGAAFLAEWQPSGPRDKPWALEQFGEPN